MEAAKVKVGMRVVLESNPHARDFPAGVIGVVVDVRRGEGFGGCDLFYVAYPNALEERPSSCGREHDAELFLVRPFGEAVLGEASAQALLDRAVDLKVAAHRAARNPKDPFGVKAAAMALEADRLEAAARELVRADSTQVVDPWPLGETFGMGEPGETCPHGGSWGSGCSDCEREARGLEPRTGFCPAGGCFRRPGHSGPCGARHEVDPLNIVQGTYPRAEAARIVSLFRPGSEGWTNFVGSPLAAEVSFLLIRPTLERLAAAGYEAIGVEVRAEGSVLAREADFRLAEFGYSAKVL